MVARSAVALVSAALVVACSSAPEPATRESLAPAGVDMSASSSAPDSVVTTTSDPGGGEADPDDVPIELPRTRWAAHLRGPTSEDEVDGVAAAPDGSLYVTGKFESAATLGDAELVSAGRADIPLARFDADGEPLWVTSFGGLGEDNIFDVDADADGAVLTGVIEGTVRFGDHSVTSAGAVDCVIVAIDPEGAVRWVRTFGGPQVDGCNEVTIGADGSIVTSIDTDGGWDSPAGPLPDQGLRDTLLVRLHRNGDVDWARHIGGPGPQRGKAIAVGPDGSVAFGGESFGDVVVEGEPHGTPGTGSGSWMTRWTSDGDLDWVITWGGAGREFVKALVHDADAVYAVGPFQGEIEVQGTRLDAGDSTDLVVARVLLSGRVDWVTSVQGEGALPGAEATSAPGGGLLLASTRPTALTIRDAEGRAAPLDDSNGGSAWLAVYRPDGSVEWAATIDGAVTASPGEISRVGGRVYLDMSVRDDANSAGGSTIVADRKDSAVWAIDLPG